MKYLDGSNVRVRAGLAFRFEVEEFGATVGQKPFARLGMDSDMLPPILGQSGSSSSIGACLPASSIALVPV